MLLPKATPQYLRPLLSYGLVQALLLREAPTAHGVLVLRLPAQDQGCPSCPSYLETWSGGISLASHNP